MTHGRIGYEHESYSIRVPSVVEIEQVKNVTQREILTQIAHELFAHAFLMVECLPHCPSCGYHEEFPVIIRRRFADTTITYYNCAANCGFSTWDRGEFYPYE